MERVGICDGVICLPDGARRALMLLPHDPVIVSLRGGWIEISRATPLPEDCRPHRRRPGRLLPWRALGPAAPVH